MATRIGLEPTTPSVTGWCSNQLSYRAIPEQLLLLLNGAADEARTRYLHLGKVALYQMSYGRISGAFIPAPSRAILANFGVPAKACEARFCGEKEKVLHDFRRGASDRNRTNDTGIFSPLLYRLSYLGIFYGGRSEIRTLKPCGAGFQDRFLTN